MEQFNDNFDYLKNNSDLIGRGKEAEEVLYRIASNNMLLIEGEKGAGKTALLKHAIDNFKGKGKVIYINIGTFGKRFDISNLLKRNSRNMILLVDNIGHLSEDNNKKIKYFYDQDYIKAVVFTTTDYDSVNFTDAIKSRIGRNVVKLKKLKKRDALEIVKGRLYNDEALPKEVLDQLYKDSGSIKELLTNCNSLCGYLEKKGKKEASLKDLGNMPRSKVEKEIENCLECNKELVNIKGYWRCENCDSFCVACGGLYDEEDKECPECGVEIVAFDRHDSGEPEVKK